VHPTQPSAQLWGTPLSSQSKRSIQGVNVTIAHHILFFTCYIVYEHCSFFFNIYISWSNICYIVYEHCFFFFNIYISWSNIPDSPLNPSCPRWQHMLIFHQICPEETENVMVGLLWSSSYFRCWRIVSEEQMSRYSNSAVTNCSQLLLDKKQSLLKMIFVAKQFITLIPALTLRLLCHKCFMPNDK